MRTSLHRMPILAALCVGSGAAHSSELAYTFLDFQAIGQTAEATGTQEPVPGQTVTVRTDEGDGISVAGSLAIGERFFVGGSFQTSIVNVNSTITNQFVTATVTDNFDLLHSRVAFGYLHEVAENLDIVAELSLDSVEYDFGSFAGENFDTDESGAGGRIGFRWNPTPAFELSSYGRFSSVGTVDLNSGEFDSDTFFDLGLRWYFFEDLGVGFDYEVGEVDTLTISLRFSFGDFAL